MKNRDEEEEDEEEEISIRGSSSDSSSSDDDDDDDDDDEEEKMMPQTQQSLPAPAPLVGDMVDGRVAHSSGVESSTMDRQDGTGSEGDTTTLPPKSSKIMGTNTKNTNTNKKKKKKRKRGDDDDNNVLEIQQERYDRVFFTAHKQLLKQAKQVKTFLLQKEIRKMQKQQQQQQHQRPQEGGGGGGGGRGVDDDAAKEDDDATKEDVVPAAAATATRSSSSGGGGTTTPVRSIKTLDVEVVTQQALRQLGLYHCNPRLKQQQQQPRNRQRRLSAQDDDDDGQPAGSRPTEPNASPSATTTTTSVVEQLLSQIPPPLLATADATFSMINSILTHKRFLQSMEGWNEKVTDYRRWCMQLEDRASGGGWGSNPFDDDNEYGTKGNKRKKNKSSVKIAATSLQVKPKKNQPHNQQQQPKAMFVTLGGEQDASQGINEGEEDNENDNDDDDDGKGAPDRYSAYGPGALLEDGPTPRRNRQGQRARRAKAVAVQAKKDGKGREHYYQSLNWRAPKTTTMTNTTDTYHTTTAAGDNRYGHVSNEGNRGNRTHRAHNYDQKPNYHQPNGGLSSRHRPDSIAAGQGSRTNTAAATHSSAPAGSEKQHPSWAAKQAQQTGIVAFKGTKITFD